MACRFAILLGLGGFEQAQGHGWITSPVPRQKGIAGGCEHCLSGGAVCGGNSYMDVFNGPQAVWKEGSVVEVTIAVTAHHKGHYEFSVCDQVITSSTANAQACLDSHILERASAQEAGINDCQPGDTRAACQPVDERHRERFYLPPPGFSPSGGNTHTFYLKLPAGLKCEACTMQWRWWTANSCIPAPDYACFRDILAANGYSNSDSWGLTNWAVKSCPGGGCNRCSCGEEFRNCVDISIEGSGGGSSGPTPTVMPTMQPSTTITMQTTTTQATTRPPTTTMPTEGCSVVARQGRTWGATAETCLSACAYLSNDEWPCNSQGPCVCGDSPSMPSPSPAPVTQSPTPAPTSAPTPRPTPSSGAGECKANPELNRGVSDSHCAQCATGYKWWPCNEASLCIGDACSGR